MITFNKSKNEVIKNTFRVVVVYKGVSYSSDITISKTWSQAYTSMHIINQKFTMI